MKLYALYLYTLGECASPLWSSSITMCNIANAGNVCNFGNVHTEVLHSSYVGIKCCNGSDTGKTGNIYW